ncbi:MAG TPA: hypothetical protein EYP33_06315 [Pyrodictium sp.]|nr:hypothetical protein [Pyrodictium sp.]
MAARTRRLRGVSPVVAAIILIMIASAAGVIVWQMVLNQGKQKTIVRLDVGATEATIPPDGSECSIDIQVMNNGNVKLTIANATIYYAAKRYTVTLNRDIMAGGQTTLSFTVKSTDIGGVKFRDGDTLKIVLTYIDPQGNSYNKSIYETISMG